MQDANSLLVRIRAGDKQAIEYVYKLCRDSFCQSMAYTWNLSAEQAANLYHDSFMAMLRSIQLGKIQQIEKAWLPLLKGIGQNLQLEKRRRDSKLPQVSFEGELPETTQENNAVNHKEQRLQFIEGELNSLDHNCRELIDLHIAKGMSFKEIYSILNPSSPLEDEKLLEKAVAIIRTQHSRCLSRLRERVIERLKNHERWN